MQDQDWRSDEDRDFDLKLENQSLEQELSLLGEEPVESDSETSDPKLKNAFLKNVIAYEEADKEPPRPIRSLFPENFEFPWLDEEISEK